VLVNMANVQNSSNGDSSDDDDEDEEEDPMEESLVNLVGNTIKELAPAAQVFCRKQIILAKLGRMGIFRVVDLQTIMDADIQMLVAALSQVLPEGQGGTGEDTAWTVSNQQAGALSKTDTLDKTLLRASRDKLITNSNHAEC
jgi:hypothetical protein